MPEQKPGRSEQVVKTPSELLNAIAMQFRVHGWDWDLAANESNHASAEGRYYGPGSAYGEDSLSENWSEIIGDLWLNPPYSGLQPWAKKCQETAARRQGRIFLLVPAAVGSNWFQDHVADSAHVVFLNPRVTFVGHTAPYPKDLVLAIYSRVIGGYSTWRWKD